MSMEVQTRRALMEPGPVPVHGPGLLLRITRGVLLYVMPLVILTGGVAGAVHLIRTAPKAERRNTERQTVPVHVTLARRATTNATLQVMGTVIPAREILLQPRVSGEVVKLDPRFVPGGRFKAGEFLLQIDPKDYELAVERARSQVADMEYQLKLEQGYQEIARREWELLDMEGKASEHDLELALRKPQLIKAQAALDAARAALGEALLALERTTIRAPFDCMIESENVDLGSQVSAQTQIARLVGTSEYWVQVAVPIDQLRWIRFQGEEGEPGSTAIIRQELGTGVQGEWKGVTTRLMSGLEPNGRMARVLVTVPNPVDAAGDAGLPLLIGAYVNVTIHGRQIEDVVELPRSLLREESRVWVVNDRNELEIREVDIVWRSRDRVLIRSGLSNGDRVVVTDLPAPVEGMALAVRTGRPGEVVAVRAEKASEQVRPDVAGAERAQ